MWVWEWGGGSYGNLDVNLLIILWGLHLNWIVCGLFISVLLFLRTLGSTVFISFCFPFYFCLFKSHFLFGSTALETEFASCPSDICSCKKNIGSWPLKGSEARGQTYTVSAIWNTAKASDQDHYKVWPDVI